MTQTAASSSERVLSTPKDAVCICHSNEMQIVSFWHLFASLIRLKFYCLFLSFFRMLLFISFVSTTQIDIGNYSFVCVCVCFVHNFRLVASFAFALSLPFNEKSPPCHSLLFPNPFLGQIDGPPILEAAQQTSPIILRSPVMKCSSSLWTSGIRHSLISAKVRDAL